MAVTGGGGGPCCANVKNNPFSNPILFAVQNNLRGLHFSHILKPNFKKKFNPHELGMKSFIKIASGQKALLKKERKKKKQKNKKPDSNGIVSQLNSSMLTLPPSMKRCWAVECQAMLRKK